MLSGAGFRRPLLLVRLFRFGSQRERPARIIHERLQPSRGSFPPDTSSDLLCDAPGIAVVGLPRHNEKSLAGTRCALATGNLSATAHSSLNETHVFRLGVRELSGLEAAGIAAASLLHHF